MPSPRLVHVREKADTKATDDPPDDHRPKTSSESLNRASDRKDDRSDEESAFSPDHIAYTARGKRGHFAEKIFRGQVQHRGLRQ